MAIKEWNEINGKLVRELSFSDQARAAEFVLSVAKISDAMNHHGDIELYSFNKVRLSVCTHDANNTITDRDRAWTKEVDQLLHIN